MTCDPQLLAAIDKTIYLFHRNLEEVYIPSYLYDDLKEYFEKKYGALPQYREEIESLYGVKLKTVDGKIFFSSIELVFKEPMFRMPWMGETIDEETKH